MFCDVVIKVLNFIVSVIRVELPKITLRLLLFCKCRFVDVLCLCRPFYIQGNISLIVLKDCLSIFFCVLVIRVDLQGAYLEKPSGSSGDFSTLIRHTYTCVADQGKKVTFGDIECFELLS